RHPGLHCFRRSIPRLYVPLSTLRVLPHSSVPRMTRGQRGSLLLHCDGLAPSTSCRSPGAPWLNPIPHAIAVYASQPPSPMATQHSLPSGRYPLLGPDSHRLDRTSLRLAHSLDHLVGNGQQTRREDEAECPGGVEVDHELEFGRLHDR